MMSIHSIPRRVLVVAVSVGAICSAVVWGQAEAPTPLDLDALKAKLDHVKSLASEDLRQVVTAKDAVAVPLSDLWPDPAPHLWVSDIGCHGIFKVLWSAAGLSPSAPIQGPMIDAVSRIPSNTAKTVLLLTGEFRELCRRKDDSVWGVLTSRAARPPDLVDACILSAIMWGDELPLLPDQATSRGQKSASTLLPQAPRPDQWNLPSGAPQKWRALFDGSNGVYRLLAMKGLDLWATSNEVPSLLRTALSDPYVSIRDDAISRMQMLSTEVQVQMLEEYSHREQARAHGTDTERDAAKWLNDRVVEKLTALRATARPISPSAK